MSYKATSIRAVYMGLGFTWFPHSMIRVELATGALRPFGPLEGAERQTTLYLIVPGRDLAGSGTLRLTELLHESARSVTGSHESALRQKSRRGRAPESGGGSGRGKLGA